MPWSEWQDSPTGQGFNWDQDVTVGSYYDTAAGTEGADAYAGGASSVEVNWTNAGVGGASEGAPSAGMQFSLSDAWRTQRNWFPSTLSSLEQGVDYGVRPDRASTDQDAFVEYEDGDNIAEATVIMGAGMLANGGATYSVSSRFGYTLGTSYAVGQPLTSFPDFSSVFAILDNEVGFTTHVESSFPVSALFPAGAAKSVLVGVSLVGERPVSGGAFQSATTSLSKPLIVTRYHMPRWRYWIPEPTKKPPLRLRQRDDNLFLNAGRIRNRSSRQTTNRLRSYD